MQAAAVGVEEGNDLKGRHLCVEDVGILEVVLPYLLDRIPEEFGCAAISRLVADVVVEASFVGRLSTNADDRGCVVRNRAVVEREAGGDGEAYPAMIGLVPRGVCEDAHEGMDPP